MNSTSPEPLAQAVAEALERAPAHAGPLEGPAHVADFAHCGGHLLALACLCACEAHPTQHPLLEKGAQWLLRHAAARPTHQFGLWHGKMGMVLTLVMTYRATGNGQWLEAALQLAQPCTAHFITSAHTPNGLAHGRAGTLWVLLLLKQESQAPWLTNAITQCCQQLVQHLRPMAQGICWQHPQAHSHGLLDLEEGNAGIAPVLAFAAQQSQSQLLALMAQEAWHFTTAMPAASGRWPNHRQAAQSQHQLQQHTTALTTALASGNTTAFLPQPMDSAWATGTAGMHLGQWLWQHLHSQAKPWPQDLWISLTPPHQALLALLAQHPKQLTTPRQLTPMPTLDDTLLPLLLQQTYPRTWALACHLKGKESALQWMAATLLHHIPQVQENAYTSLIHQIQHAFYNWANSLEPERGEVVHDALQLENKALEHLETHANATLLFAQETLFRQHIRTLFNSTTQAWQATTLQRHPAVALASCGWNWQHEKLVLVEMVPNNPADNLEIPKGEFVMALLPRPSQRIDELQLNVLEYRILLLLEKPKTVAQLHSECLQLFAPEDQAQQKTIQAMVNEKIRHMLNAHLIHKSI